MAALQDRRARLLAALYDKFGEPATWTPAAGGAAVTVTIRRMPEDVALGFGESEVMAAKDSIRVRESEVAAPAQGDLVAILDPDTGLPTGEAFKIVADPMLVRGRPEWVCDPAPVRNF